MIESPAATAAPALVDNTLARTLPAARRASRGIGAAIAHDLVARDYEVAWG
ncbi:MAG: hypothetical protein ACLPTF_14840 [Steroidobacteraceae bacterium]